MSRVTAQDAVVVVDGLRIAATHPCLAGHFPGNPVVPAVVLLDEVLAAIQARQPDFEARLLSSVKFLSPLLPEETFSIRLEPVGRDMRFECHAGTRLLAKGSMRGGEPGPTAQ